MKRTLLVACTAVGILTTASIAAAQPGNYAEPPPGQEPTVAPVHRVQKWGIGLRLTSMDVRSADNEDNEISLAGAGIHVRYLLASHWRAELTLEGVENDNEDELGYTRSSGMATLGMHYIFNPYDAWNVYGLAGIGRTSTEIIYQGNASETVEKFEESHFHLGIGLERRFENLSLGAELRAVGLTRDDEAGDGEFYAGVDGPVPVESEGGQFNVQLTYNF
jgi:opacity protein-like surface antigen